MVHARAKIFTFESKGKASKTVLRRMMLDINIWLFRALSAPKTSLVTFFGLKQKWQSTLSEWKLWRSLLMVTTNWLRRLQKGGDWKGEGEHTASISNSYFPSFAYRSLLETYAEPERVQRTAVHCSSVHPDIKFEEMHDG